MAAIARRSRRAMPVSKWPPKFRPQLAYTKTIHGPRRIRRSASRSTEPAPLYRSAPHNIEAEQALLGAILVNNEAFYRVSDFLEPGAFLRADPPEGLSDRARPDPRRQDRHPGHAQDLPRRQHRHRRPDAQPISRAARRRGHHHHQCRGLRPHRLRPVDPPRADPGRRGHGQRRLSTRRSISRRATRSRTPSASCSSWPRPAATTAASSASRQALTTAVDMAAHAYQRDGKLSGIATGLDDLDRMMGGLQPSDLIILAGRPGMGKTALATNIAYNVARPGAARSSPTAISVTVNGGIVGFFSLEMSAEQLATRIIAEQTGIPSNQIRRGAISEADFEKIKDYSIELQNLPLYRRRDRRPVDRAAGRARAPAQAPARARPPGHRLPAAAARLDQARSRKTACRKSPRSPPGSRRWPRNCNVPIMALSQLSRQVESRDDKRPQLSDLRESGSIEQDADVVLFVYREEYYHQMRKPLECDREKFADWLAEATRCTARPKSSSASSATAPPARSNCSSTARSPSSSPGAERPPAGADGVILLVIPGAGIAR